MNCFLGMARWFGSSSGLYLMLGTMFVFGILAGLGVAPYLPDKFKKFLGF